MLSAYYGFKDPGDVLKVGARGFDPTFMPFEQTPCPYEWRNAMISAAFLDSHLTSITCSETRLLKGIFQLQEFLLIGGFR